MVSVQVPEEATKAVAFGEPTADKDASGEHSGPGRSRHERMADYCRGQAQAAKKRMAAVGHICWARPHVVLVPVVLCGLMMGLGVWAVLKGADSQADSLRREVQSQAQSAASSLELTIQQVLFPLEQVVDFVMFEKNYTYINATWQQRVSKWYRPTAGSFLSLDPAGLGMNVYPTNSLSVLHLNFDMLNVSYIRPRVIASLAYPNVMQVFAPTLVKRDGKAYYLTSFLTPMFVPDVSPEETWNIKWNVTRCPPGACYKNATRSKFWGIAGMTLFLDPFISSEGPLSQLMKVYNWQIWVPSGDNPASPKMVLDASGLVKAQPTDAAMATARVANGMWELYVWPDSWEPSWKVPLIVVVVVVSLVLSVLLFAVLLSREEHQVLLRSLLPEATINRLRTEIDWKDLKSARSVVELVEIETPAQQILTVLQAFLDGTQPPMALVLSAQQALQESKDVYRPPSKELQSRLKEADMDDEARLALARTLGSSTDSSTHMRRYDPDATNTALMGGDAAEELDASETDAIMRSMMVATRRASQFMSSASLESYPSIGVGVDSDGASLPSDPAPFRERRPNLELDGIKSPPVAKPIMEEVDRLLAQALTSWEFDSYALEAATQGHPLSVLAFWLMSQGGLLGYASVQPTTLARFLRRVEAGYPKANPYHNARHAADVLQTFHMVLRHGGLVPGYADQHTVLSCYLAAVIHDYEHRGLSTDFLTSSGDSLAVLYNDKSPMENHHLAAAWALLMQPQFNILSGLSKDAVAKMRKLVIELVLSTDMKQHFSIMGQFSAQLSTNAAAQRVSAPSSSDGARSSAAQRPSNPALQPVNEGERLLSLQMALKCADLGHLCESLPVHLRWVQDLEQEFFLQGDEERARGMPISPLCDRNKEGVTKSQVGFFDFVCMPLFAHFTSRFTAARPLLDGLHANYAHWKALAAAARQSVSGAAGAQPGPAVPPASPKPAAVCGP